MRTAVQYHPSLYYVTYLGTLLFAVQLNVFTSLLWLLFIVCYLFLVMQQDTEHSQLVEILVECSTFECNNQKIIAIKKYYVIFKNRNVQLSFENSKTDTWRELTKTNEKLLVFSVESTIFTTFVFKLVFRVKGRSAPWDIPGTSKRTMYTIYMKFSNVAHESFLICK